jgi:hypothetical protein
MSFTFAGGGVDAAEIEGGEKALLAKIVADCRPAHEAEVCNDGSVSQRWL